jgi:hypothetical protein
MRMLVIGAMAMVLSAAGLASRDGSPAQGETDGLLAPIALYPDQLLAQILLCASSPATISELGTWLTAHETLKGSDLQDAATLAGFEPSFVVLALFPRLVEAMATRLDWTTRLGHAFVSDRTAVFAAVQRLRAHARESGALKSTPQQDVDTIATTSGPVIVIEPANPQVVYVPQYDPDIVYTQGDAAVAGVVGFATGIAIGAAIDNNYYDGPYGWRGGAYMYDDAWDDWVDAREDAREDWGEHRQELAEERGDRARSTTADRARIDHTGMHSDAFSGYSNGRSERATSSRGHRSRNSARQSEGRRR